MASSAKVISPLVAALLLVAPSCSSPSPTCSNAPSTCPDGTAIQACIQQNGDGSCASAYYSVGSQTFACASCGDCLSAAQAAAQACSGGGDGGPVEGVTLVVNSATQVSGTGLQAGDVFVAVNMQLQDGGTMALPLIPTLFAVVQSGGVEYSGSPDTVSYTGGCDATASVAPDGTVSCTVLFEAPQSFAPDLLTYELPDGAKVTAALTVQPCSLCAGQCVDLQSDPANCGACGKIVPSNAQCKNGKISCASGTTLCGSVCANTQADASNCGACGKSCVNHKCYQGTCIKEVDSTTTASCASVCGGSACVLALGTYVDNTFTCGKCEGSYPLSCAAAPPATETTQGCTCTFEQMACECAE